MSTADTLSTPSPAHTSKAALPREYGFSVLVSGFGRSFRGFIPFAIIILCNTVVQVLLMSRPVYPLWSFTFVGLAIVSLIFLLAFFAMMNVTALAAVHGRVSISRTLSGTRQHLVRTCVWTFGYFLVCLIGSMFYTIPGLILLLVGPFIPLAAADGQRNPLAANFKVFRARPIRSIITVLIVAGVLLVSVILAILNGFFVQGATGAAIMWLYFGMLGAWLLTALAALYRSTAVGDVNRLSSESAAEGR